MQHYLKWPGSIQHPAAPKIQLPLSLSSTVNLFQHPNSFHRIDTNAIISDFTEILTNSTLNLPPRLRSDLTPSSFLAQFGHLTSNFATKMHQSVDSQFTVYSHNFRLCDCFKGASLWNGRRVLNRRSRWREDKQKERSARAALPWGWGCRPGPRVGPKICDMYPVCT